MQQVRVLGLGNYQKLVFNFESELELPGFISLMLVLFCILFPLISTQFLLCLANDSSMNFLPQLGHYTMACSRQAPVDFLLNSSISYNVQSYLLLIMPTCSTVNEGVGFLSFLGFFFSSYSNLSWHWGQCILRLASPKSRPHTQQVRVRGFLYSVMKFPMPSLILFYFWALGCLAGLLAPFIITQFFLCLWYDSSRNFLPQLGHCTIALSLQTPAAKLLNCSISSRLHSYL